MNCSFAEKVSMLLDDELSLMEIESIRAHIADCSECRNLEKDFLFFRQQIKTSVSDFSDTGEVKVSPFPIRKQTPVWSRWISLPVPALALFAFALVCLGAWIASSRFSRNSIDTAMQAPVNNAAPKKENPPSEISLARYDNGGRAEIYVMPRQAK
jgi:anti-sigma factor RsiW